MSIFFIAIHSYILKSVAPRGLKEGSLLHPALLYWIDSILHKLCSPEFYSCVIGFLFFFNDWILSLLGFLCLFGHQISLGLHATA